MMAQNRFVRSAQRWSGRFQEKHLRRFIFIHINKTAGMSIQTALGIRSGRHQTALEKKEALGDARWAKRFCFTFVRNPWDRAVSQYHWRVVKNRVAPADNPVDFNEWVRLTFKEQAPAYNSGSRLFIPQWDWITDREGTVLVDFIGRFENLADDFHTVCTRIGKQATLPHRNKSQRTDYRTYYNDASIEIIGHWYAADHNAFGYTFDDPGQARTKQTP